MRKILLIITFLLISSNLNADPKYTIKNGKSVEIEDPYYFKGEIVKIYRFTDYDVLHIKDERSEIVKGRVNIRKNDEYRKKQIQYKVGQIEKFNCTNFNYSEYEYCSK